MYDFILLLNMMPPEFTSLLMLLGCGVFILLFLRLFGLMGLYLFINVAVLAGNIQVLKAVQFSYFSHPIALGTIVFSATYLCTDVITEYYGQAEARRAVLLSIGAMILMTFLMYLTLGWQPLGVSAGSLRDSHFAMKILFLPAPGIMLASLIAYLISQYSDIWLYVLIRKVTGEKWLWLRTNLSTALAALIDNIIFSILAWIVFSPRPLEVNTVIFTYIFGTLFLRVAFSFFNTPFVYISQWFLPEKEKERYARL